MFKCSNVQIDSFKQQFTLNLFEPSKFEERFQILTLKVVSERRFELFKLKLEKERNPVNQWNQCTRLTICGLFFHEISWSERAVQIIDDIIHDSRI